MFVSPTRVWVVYVVKEALHTSRKKAVELT